MAEEVGSAIAGSCAAIAAALCACASRGRDNRGGAKPLRRWTRSCRRAFCMCVWGGEPVAPEDTTKPDGAGAGIDASSSDSDEERHVDDSGGAALADALHVLLFSGPFHHFFTLYGFYTVRSMACDDNLLPSSFRSTCLSRRAARAWAARTWLRIAPVCYTLLTLLHVALEFYGYLVVHPTSNLLEIATVVAWIAILPAYLGFVYWMQHYMVNNLVLAAHDLPLTKSIRRRISEAVKACRIKAIIITLILLTPLTYYFTAGLRTFTPIFTGFYLLRFYIIVGGMSTAIGSWRMCTSVLALYARIVKERFLHIGARRHVRPVAVTTVLATQNKRHDGASVDIEAPASPAIPLTAMNLGRFGGGNSHSASTAEVSSDDEGADGAQVQHTSLATSSFWVKHVNSERPASQAHVVDSEDGNPAAEAPGARVLAHRGTGDTALSPVPENAPSSMFRVSRGSTASAGPLSQSELTLATRASMQTHTVPSSRWRQRNSHAIAVRKRADQDFMECVAHLRALRTALAETSHSVALVMAFTNVLLLITGIAYLFLSAQLHNFIFLLYAAAFFMMALFVVFVAVQVSAATTDILQTITRAPSPAVASVLARNSAVMALLVSSSQSADAITIFGAPVRMTGFLKLGSLLVSILLVVANQNARLGAL